MEALVAIVILTILIASVAGWSGKSRDKARRVTVDQLIGMVEQARSQAITTHSTVLLAFALPGDLPQHTESCAVSMVRLLEGWDPSAATPVDATLLGRWKPLETGVILGNGQVSGLTNPLDGQPLTLRINQPRPIQAVVRGLAFNERGRLIHPSGSAPVAIRVAEGAYVRAVATPQMRGGRVSESCIKIGRVVGHAYEFSP